jgi:hypothetical protein
MKPAWAITYEIRGAEADGTMAGWRWTGRVESHSFLLEEPPADADPTLLGTATVTSWQPYLDDALEDALRAVLDLCAVVGTSYGGPSVEPVLPPSIIQELAGAKTSRAVGVPESMSFAMTQPLEDGLSWFAAVDLVQEDPELRADLDTLVLARKEQNAAARFVHLYRIFDRHIRRVLEGEPPLLSSKQQGVATEALLDTAAYFQLKPIDLERLRSSFTNAIAKVRERSRFEILEAHFATAAFADLHISRSVLRRLDTVHVDAAGHLDFLRDEPEVASALFAIAHRIVRMKLQNASSRDVLTGS